MAILGLLLLLIGVGLAAFSIWVTTAGTPATNADGTGGLTIPILGGNGIQLQTTTLVILGVVGVLLALLGLWMMIAASKRAARRARERRELRKTQKRQEKELNETRSRLAASENRHDERYDDRHVDPRSAEGRPVRGDATYAADEREGGLRRAEGRSMDDPRDGTMR